MFLERFSIKNTSSTFIMRLSGALSSTVHQCLLVLIPKLLNWLKKFKNALTIWFVISIPIVHVISICYPTVVVFVQPTFYSMFQSIIHIFCTIFLLIAPTLALVVLFNLLHRLTKQSVLYTPWFIFGKKTRSFSNAYSGFNKRRRDVLQLLSNE